MDKEDIIQHSVIFILHYNVLDEGFLFIASNIYNNYNEHNICFGLFFASQVK